MGTCASVLSVLDHPTIETQEKSVEEKRLAVLEKIRSEPIIVEMKILFYIAACDSMIDQSKIVPSPRVSFTHEGFVRVHQCALYSDYFSPRKIQISGPLKGIPPELEAYLNKEPSKVVIQEVNESIPNIKLLQLYLENPSLNQISDDLLTLLYWLLIGLKEPQLLILENENEWPELDFYCDSEDNIKKPDMVLKLCYSTKSMRYMTWKAKSYGKKPILGFTNVRLSDIHAAIHCGTRQLISRVGTGYGLSIESNISSCYKKNEFCWTWGKSTIGTQMSVVMVLEYVENSNSMVKMAHESTYYLLSDPSYARIRYLLIWIYSRPPSHHHAIKNLMVKNNTSRIISSIVLTAALLLLKKAPSILQKVLFSMGHIAKRHK